MHNNTWHGPVPFNPSKHKPIELKDGKFMTERLISIDAPDGRTWAIPTVWFDQEGKHSQVSNTTASRIAEMYENATGVIFPRFDTVAEAEAFIRKRSAMGGASKSMLTRGGK